MLSLNEANATSIRRRQNETAMLFGTYQDVHFQVEAVFPRIHQAYRMTRA